ncbi:MAG: excinuclease ABC subunit A [Gammaproteobacteria bacterium]|nr:excinuclease ABC subunit A [Gammaproteobacteria bacterium]
MRNLLLIVMVNIFLMPSASARDTVASYSVVQALSLEQTKSALGSDIRFYFGDQEHRSVVKNFGEFRSNNKTNAFGKSDKVACQWVFLSAMIVLRNQAIREGGNAVIDIKSNYRNKLTSSNNSFQCGAGNFVAGVALVGTVVALEK